MSIASISIENIDTSDRLRPVDQNWVVLLADSMCEQGLSQPIMVSAKRSDGSYKLLIGSHRLEAAKLLEWPEIDALIVPENDELKQRLLEIDENLFRRELSALDRAVFLSQRQEIHEVMYPDSKAGIAGGLARHGLQRTSLSFAETVSEKMGLTPRSIRRSLQRANKIDPKVREMIGTTALADSGAELDALLKLAPTDQLKCAAAILREKDPVKNVKAALLELHGSDDEVEFSVQEKELDALKRRYVRASEETQRQFHVWLDELGVE